MVCPVEERLIPELPFARIWARLDPETKAQLWRSSTGLMGLVLQQVGELTLQLPPAGSQQEAEASAATSGSLLAKAATATLCKTFKMSVKGGQIEEMFEAYVAAGGGKLQAAVQQLSLEVSLGSSSLPN